MSSQKDFSLFSLFTAGLACLLPLASAYTQPTGDAPEGNPISEPGLNSVVPAGENFTVTWQPTTHGTVTLVLLKGPSSNAVPQNAIAEKIPNSGSYIWSVSSDLAPSENAQGYGIQLIDDATGQYQYTTQFGISNADYEAPSSASASSHSGHGAYQTSWSSDWSSSSSWDTATDTTVTATHTATAIVHHDHNTTDTITRAPSTATATSLKLGPGPVSGAPHNVTIVSPTGSMTVPATLQTSASSSTSAAGSSSSAASASAPTHSNAAAAMGTSLAGLVFAAGVAVFAL